MKDKVTGGIFLESLLRNNKEIRDDRAKEIVESAEINYRREVEDMELEITKLERDRNSMLDLSPIHADSLILASDFDAKKFIAKDVEIGVRLRNLRIKLKISKERYDYLFKPEVVK